MKSFYEGMKTYMITYPFGFGDPNCRTVPEHAESYEFDPQEIDGGFKKL